jgi:hypothetical protein
MTPHIPPKLTAQTLSQLKNTLGWKTQQQQQELHQQHQSQSFGLSFLQSRPAITETENQVSSFGYCDPSKKKQNFIVFYL